MHQNKRLSSGVKKRLKKSLDLNFSDWHRARLPRDCYATNIDFLEYRHEGDEIVLKGVLEVKQVKDVLYTNGTIKNDKLAQSSVQAAFKLSQLLKIPFIYILYDPDEIKESLKTNNIEHSSARFFVWLPSPNYDMRALYKSNRKVPIQELFIEMNEKQLIEFLKDQLA